MARTVVRLEEEEVMYFHLNYAYMWKKLNTAPYYVSGAGEIPKWIREQWLLPSYANLSKCLSSDYVPSLNIVNKIVQFYNANIQPEVDTYAFLHERLESSDNIRSTGAAADTNPYCGLYCGYYYAGLVNKKEIYGAMLMIRKIHDTTVAEMITGITDDEDMGSMALRELFDGKDVSLEKYTEYKSRLELHKRRTVLYKGAVDLAPGLMTLRMQSEDVAGSMLTVRLSLDSSTDDQYLGSIGLMTLFSEHDMQLLKFGILRADIKGVNPFSLDDEQLREVLAIEKLPNEHIQIAFRDSTAWNDMILANAN